ncbi:MAG: hypothetical protein ABFC24_04415 [Methanoregulaceae archaeon]
MVKFIEITLKKIINFVNNKWKVSMDRDLDPSDWILPFLLMGSEPGQPVVKGSLLLFKEFFVFVKEIKPELDAYFKFVPYDYGPYSFQLRTNLDTLLILRDIKIERINDRTDYYLTDEGRLKAQNLLDEIEQKTQEKITKLRKDGTKLGYIGVLSYVYARYPEYTTASKIKDDVKCH